MHYCHGGKHGGMQVDRMLEKEQGVLYPDRYAAESGRLLHRVWLGI